jgi:hypothetical protein
MDSTGGIRRIRPDAHQVLECSGMTEPSILSKEFNRCPDAIPWIPDRPAFEALRATDLRRAGSREGEAPAEPKRAVARRPPEALGALLDASGGRRPGGRLGSAGASPVQPTARRKPLPGNNSKAGRFGQIAGRIWQCLPTEF